MILKDMASHKTGRPSSRRIQNGGGKRNSSIELLRLLSMLMIVSFHLCVGNRYDWFLAQPPTPTKVAYQFLMGGGWVGTFIFFTISIWFLLDRQNTLKSSLKRIWILERELLFWSLALFAATLFLRKAGLYSGSVLKLAAHSVLPLTTSLWWYPTSYAMFLLLLPFLVTGMKALGERAHRSLALIALLMWGIAGLLPFTRNDLHGGSVLVFVYWFVLLSYYRWYMERISAATCWKLILAGLGIEVVYCLAFSLVFAMTGKGAGFQFFIFDNWKIPSMFIGFGLFELFARREFHSRCVNCLAGSAFGVYLVHYHPAVKTLWMNWLPLDKLYLSAHPLAAMTVCVLAIFACCLALDLVRQGLFAMTVDRNRGRWFELVWNKATERTKPMPVHTVPVHTEK